MTRVSMGRIAIFLGLTTGLGLILACTPEVGGQQGLATGITQEDCAALADLEIQGGSVISVRHNSTGRFEIENPGQFMPPVVEDVPRVCELSLVATPVAGSRIGVEVWMPEKDWNGRLLMVGNGGYSSSIAWFAMADGVRKGYAMLATDTGHQGDDPDFARDHPERIADWAWRSVHEAVSLAGIVLEEAYGRGPDFRYFAGCSTGGHQALMSAQRFPADFDGIIAGAPGHNRTHLNAGFLWQFLSNHDREPPNPEILPAGKLNLLNQAVMAQCEEQNGGDHGGLADDPWLNDPLACNVDPHALQCEGRDGDDCLQPREADAARAIYDGARNPRTGKRIYFGQLPGTETAGGPPQLPGWSLYWANPLSPDQPARTSFWKIWALHDDEWDWWTFDFDADIHTTDDRLAQNINAMNPDLSGFAKNGGKLLHYHGLNDAVVPATDSIDYYQRARELAGSDISTFYRLYLAPGVNHCNGGPGADQFDLLDSLVKWVEDGDAPERIIARKIADPSIDSEDGSNVLFERPLCRFPQRAVYDGVGDKTSADSFSCKETPAVWDLPELGDAYRR